MSLMGKFLPHYQFFERHQTTVQCSPGELLDIVQGYAPPPDRLTEMAMYLRQLRQHSPDCGAAQGCQRKSRRHDGVAIGPALMKGRAARTEDHLRQDSSASSIASNAN